MTDEHQAHGPSHPKTRLLTYFVIFFLLMIGTAITVAVAQVDLGRANTPIAMAIAIIKATLVILFFMHVIHSTRLTWVIVISAFLWLSLLFVLTFADYLTRGWVLT